MIQQLKGFDLHRYVISEKKSIKLLLSTEHNISDVVESKLLIGATHCFNALVAVMCFEQNLP